jgi:hypothetical protein
MRIENLGGVPAFVTLDGSTIREVAGPATGNAANQSLAEATVPEGGATTEHYHRATRRHRGDRARRAPQGLEHRPRATSAPLRLLPGLFRRGHRPHGELAKHYTF